MPESASNPGRFLTASILAAVLVLAGTLAFLSRGLPEMASEPLRFDAMDLRFVMGSGQVEGDRIAISGFADGYALLTSGPVQIRADDYRYLRVRLDAPVPDPNTTLFWRSSEAPQDLSQLLIRETGAIVLDLSERPAWRGEISEIGFLFRETPGVITKLDYAGLEAESLSMRLRSMWEDWTSFERWTQQSINFLEGGKPRQIVRLPLLVFAWFVLTTAFAAIFALLGKRRKFKPLAASSLVIFMAAWLILDVRWTANNVRQAKKTFGTLWGLDDGQKMSAGLDGNLYQYIERLKAEILPREPARVLIVGDQQTSEYVFKRAKYHLLPHSAFADQWPLPGFEPHALEYVLFFTASTEPIDGLDWSSTWEQELKVIERNEWGVVFGVSRSP